VTYPFLTNQKTLECYLYPDTYFVKEADFKPEDLIKKMLDNFNSKVYKPHLK
jgi:cell division protein YceG involved in septum cleavage